MQVVTIEHRSIVQGVFELRLVNRRNGHLIKIVDYNGVPCARAEIGMNYAIHLRVKRDCNGNFPSDHLSVLTSIDSRSIGCNMHLNLSNEHISNDIKESSKFIHGFYDDISIHAFTFSAIKGGDTSINNESYTKPIGCISVSIYAAERVPVPWNELQVVPHKAQHCIPPLQVSINEQKKFWQQPSAMTLPGEVVCSRGSKVNRTTCCTYKRTRLLTELTLHYHTQDMMNFLSDFKQNVSMQDIFSTSKLCKRSISNFNTESKATNIDNTGHFTTSTTAESNNADKTSTYKKARV